MSKCPCGDKVCNKYFLNISSDGRFTKEQAEYIIKCVNGFDELEAENAKLKQRVENMANILKVTDSKNDNVEAENKRLRDALEEISTSKAQFKKREYLEDLCMLMKNIARTALKKQ